MDGIDPNDSDAILRDLERRRDLLKQDLEPDARREVERLIRQAEDRLREMQESRKPTD
jgi:F0F1-type ATP synthase membrane subunit b/b'